MMDIIGVVSEILNTNENRPFTHKSLSACPRIKHTCMPCNGRSCCIAILVKTVGMVSSVIKLSVSILK
ncbi:hypothetical protein D9M72_156530 [compost metagenome]